MDFGGAVPLADMHELALAAGAVRCHALDVREEFARRCLLPALNTRALADPREAFDLLAPDFAARKLAEIARIEDATILPPGPVSIAARPMPKAAPPPVQLDVRFECGVPVAINGVEMSLIELMESLETITGEPALHVLDRQLAAAQVPQLA